MNAPSESVALAELRLAKPFLKWAGGKTQILPQLEPHFPKVYSAYFEPFLGGGAVFFRLRPPQAVLSDSNPELIAAFVAVRNRPIELMEALDRHAERTNRTYYYEIRRQQPTKLSPVDRAARMIFLNKTCFNGLYRVNSRGEFNVPYGLDYYPGKTPILYERESLLEASRLLKSARLLVKDYQSAVKAAGKGDFVYFDPPYHPLSPTSGFTSYTKEVFGDPEQRGLAETVRNLHGRGCKVMLSNSPTHLVRSLYEGFHQTSVRARRAINSKGTRRGEIDELLVTNYE